MASLRVLPYPARCRDVVGTWNDMSIEVKALQSLAAGAWLTESGNKNEGALRAKGSAIGTRFYYRYRDSAGRYDDLPIGSFDTTGKRGMTLIEARARVRALRNRYLNGARDLRAIIDAETREAIRARLDAEQADEAAQARKSATLGALIDAYVANLKRQGKVSWRSVETAMHRNIRDAWPKLWIAPADQIQPDDLLDIINRMADAGTLREAGKMRSYLRAAYGAAIKARRQAGSLPALRALRLTSNPARELETVEGGSGGTRARALSLAELRAYWRHINALPGPNGALLRLHLLTGGQRQAQLGRVVAADLDADAQAIRIRDSKGRRSVARVHVVPLIDAALDAMRMLCGDAGPYLFTLDRGLSGATTDHMRSRVSAIADAMADAGELENGTFTPGDLRRTVETRLAAEGVPVHVRAQLQSHGLGGVQAKHYDRHDYMSEKRAALETLHRLCTGTAAQVIPMKRRK